MAASNGSTLSGLVINVGGVMTSSNSTFNNVTIDAGSTVQGQNGTSTTLTGSVTNNGTIALNSTNGYTDLILSGEPPWSRPAAARSRCPIANTTASTARGPTP